MTNEQREAMGTPMTLSEIVEEIQDLNKQYGIALDHKGASERCCTATLNNLDKAQKRFDQAVLDFKKRDLTEAA